MGGSKSWVKPGEAPKCKSRCIHSGKNGTIERAKVERRDDM